VKAAIHLLRMAIADIRRDALISVCAALTLAATLAPLLTLLGLERGAVGAIIDRMDRDPAMRSITPEVTGAHRFDRAWFQRIAELSEVAFVMPNTRAIAGQVDLYSKNASAPVRVAWLPTAAGDPVTSSEAYRELGLDRLVLSAATADRLKARRGDSITAAIERQREGRMEPAQIELVVEYVLPIERHEGYAAFVSLELLEAVQAFRDGYAVRKFGLAGDGEARPIEAYPLFRLYARSIRDVAALAQRLEGEGISASTRASEIEAALGLRRNLLAILAIIASFAAAGYAVALAAAQIAAVRRKKREFAILKLIGYGRGWLTALPCVEALLLTLAGFAFAHALYGSAALAINRYFAAHLATGEAACRLHALDSLWVMALTLSVVAGPAIISGIMGASVDAGDELRDV
jgi:putative ABC transport system permease protein